MITNIRSLMAKLIIRMLVVERINGLKATTTQSDIVRRRSLIIVSTASA